MALILQSLFACTIEILFDSYFIFRSSFSSLQAPEWTDWARRAPCRHNCNRCWWWCFWESSPSILCPYDRPTSWPSSACNYNNWNLHNDLRDYSIVFLLSFLKIIFGLYFSFPQKIIHFLTRYSVRYSVKSKFPSTVRAHNCIWKRHKVFGSSKTIFYIIFLKWIFFNL